MLSFRKENLSLRSWQMRVKCNVHHLIHSIVSLCQCNEHGTRFPAPSSWPVPHHPCTLSPVSHAWLVSLKCNLLVRDHIWYMQGKGVRRRGQRAISCGEGHDLAYCYTNRENTLGSEVFWKKLSPIESYEYLSLYNKNILTVLDKSFTFLVIHEYF